MKTPLIKTTTIKKDFHPGNKIVKTPKGIDLELEKREYITLKSINRMRDHKLFDIRIHPGLSISKMTLARDTKSLKLRKI